MAKRDLLKAINEGEKIAFSNQKASVDSVDFYFLAQNEPSKVDAAMKAYLLGLAIGCEIGKESEV